MSLSPPEGGSSLVIHMSISKQLGSDSPGQSAAQALINASPGVIERSDCLQKMRGEVRGKGNQGDPLGGSSGDPGGSQRKGSLWGKGAHGLLVGLACLGY